MTNTIVKKVTKSIFAALKNVTKVEKINVGQLAAILYRITQSTVCNIIYIVDDSRSKQIKGKKQVQKMVQITHCYLNHDYTNKVKNLTGNDNFVAEPLRGKTRICGTLLKSDGTQELMIDGKVLKTKTAKVLCYFHEGKEISEAEAIALDLWADSYYKPNEKNTKGRGTVSEANDFNIINTYLSRIYRIKLQKQWYEVVN